MRSTTVNAFNDLILINNDRLKEYQLVLEEAHKENQDLEVVFLDIIAQIEKFNHQLRQFVESNGSKAETDSSVSGKIHRSWLNFKFSLKEHNRKYMLIACEHCEDVTKEVYKEVLYSDNDMTQPQREVIAAQLEEQKATHNAIKILRDKAIADC
jgi:uncharacterized protein (TIGR02284 family)